MSSNEETPPIAGTSGGAPGAGAPGAGAPSAPPAPTGAAGGGAAGGGRPKRGQNPGAKISSTDIHLAQMRGQLDAYVGDLEIELTKVQAVVDSGVMPGPNDLADGESLNKDIYDEATKLHADLRKANEPISASLKKYIEANPDPDDYKLFVQRITDAQTRFGALTAKLLGTQALLVTTAPPAPTAATAAALPKQIKPNDLVQPLKLKSHSSPKDVYEWKEQVYDWASYPNAEVTKLPANLQKRYISLYVDEEILEYLKKTWNDRTTLYRSAAMANGEPSIIDIVTSFFNQRHPLANRRLEYLKYVSGQPAGIHDTEKRLAKIEQHARLAEFYDVTGSEAVMLFMLNNIGDQELKSRILREPTKTSERMWQLARERTSELAQLKHQGNGHGNRANMVTHNASAASAYPKTKKGKKKPSSNKPTSPKSGSKTGSKAGSKSGQPSFADYHANLRKEGKCIRCGSSNCKGGDHCRHKDTVCNYCKKKGHLETVCHAKRIGKPKTHTANTITASIEKPTPKKGHKSL